MTILELVAKWRSNADYLENQLREDVYLDEKGTARYLTIMEVLRECADELQELRVEETVNGDKEHSHWEIPKSKRKR